MRSKEMSDVRWAAIVLAGGTGSRMNAKENKVFLPLGGVPVLIHTLRRIMPHVHHTVIVYGSGELARMEALLPQYGIQTDQITFLPGGAARQDSVYSGLQGVPQGTTHVLIHDGARCFVPAEVIKRVKEAVLTTGAAIPGVPVTDTIKETDQAQVIRTVERTSLSAVQTPQGFSLPLICGAHDHARMQGFLGTDDASLLELQGVPCTIVPGDSANMKLTTPEDWKMAEASMQAMTVDRVGLGFDVHQLVEGRKLILCGVEIPHTMGLLGHSDADAAAHALMDAMLGAMAMGDIGRHFPDTDAQYKDVDSMMLLRHVKSLMDKAGGSFINGDITIAAQRPKLAPFIENMRKRLAEVLEVPVSALNVKATTTERLGFVGREEGISAQAVCMIRMPSETI